MYTITKSYSNLKAAHRQWRHPGHCAQIHGENWRFDITFSASKLDEMNFVVDFGDLKDVATQLDVMFDHTLLVDHDDPAMDTLVSLAEHDLVRLQVVPSASAEGLSKLVFEVVNTMIESKTNGRVSVVHVVCFEDSKNSATYYKA